MKYDTYASLKFVGVLSNQSLAKRAHDSASTVTLALQFLHWRDAFLSVRILP